MAGTRPDIRFRRRDAKRTLLSLLVLAGAAPAQSSVANGDFELGRPGGVPTGWVFPGAGRDAGYRAGLTDESPRHGKRCALLEHVEGDPGRGFGNLMQTLDGAPYRGKRIVFRAWVRTEGAGKAQLWVRVDRKGRNQGFFDNMGDRPIASPEWGAYQIVGDVEDDAATLNVGVLLLGGGRAWIDEASLETVEKPALRPDPARPLEGRALENVLAFARLFGYVRYFHPSDEAAAADWDRLAIEGVRAVEPAKNARALARALEDHFRVVAPALRVSAGRDPPEEPDVRILGNAPPDLQVVAWRHDGLGPKSGPSVYRSVRERAPAPGGEVPDGFRDPADPFRADLGGGVSCALPLALFADGEGTLPRGAGGNSRTDEPSPTVHSASERAVRIASVVLAWNVFQHFYPYFEVVEVDWPAALRDALAAAASDRDERAFLETLRGLVARLEDGHGNVGHRSDDATHRVPLLWDWVEERLVVTAVAPEGAEGVERGDAILAIDGRPAADALADVERSVSGATPQWIRWVGLARLASGPKDSTVALEVEVEGAGGRRRAVRLRRTLPPGAIAEPRPPKVAEIRPGIWYVDLDRIADEDFEEALPRLESAEGIVFDLRGYPRQVSTVVLAHLVDAPVTCAQWHIPSITRPDREGLEYRFSNWGVTPKAPRLRAKAAFVTDGRAISYAETYLGIVEHYRLAEIVGGPTAGTNGNVNPFALPGGYRVVWTGMKVLKHDGTRHHGVGILPTIPVSRTRAGIAAGRDELLERAVAAVAPDPARKE